MNITIFQSFDDFQTCVVQVLNLISRGITKFTLDVDHAIDSGSSPSNDNLIFSPISLTTTLAMILLASGGKTFEEASKILGLESGVDISQHSEVVHQIFGLLINESLRRQSLNPQLPQSNFGFGIFVEVSRVDGLLKKIDFST